MLSCEIILAAIFLANPDVGEKSPTEWIEALAPALIALAVSGEIIDSNEGEHWRGILANGYFEMFAARCREAACLPRLDGSSFTSAHLAEEQRFNRQFMESLRARRLFDSVHEEILDEAICETDWSYRVLCLASTAANRGNSVFSRRQALGELRAAIGDVAYYSGVLPPPVPLRHLPKTR